MRGNLKSASIRILGLLLLFLITASGVFAFSSAKSHLAKPVLSVETALKAIDFASENDISIDSEFSANLRRGIEFTGRRYSELTNQYWNRNRYYSPALGRFTSKDPIGFNGGYNLFRYADNNPVLFTDPTGQLPWGPAAIAAGGILLYDFWDWYSSLDQECWHVKENHYKTWPMPLRPDIYLIQYQPTNCEREQYKEAGTIGAPLSSWGVSWLTDTGCIYWLCFSNELPVIKN